MTLGAASQGTVALVTATAPRIVAIGIVVGIGLVLITGRVVAAICAQFLRTTPRYAFASAAGMVIGVLASALPARWASRVDPMIALGGEQGCPTLEVRS